MRIVWNPQAQANLRSIQTYLQDAGLDQEKIEDIIRNIFSAVDRLEKHARSGRIVPEIGDPDFREVLWKSWRIIYLMPQSPGIPLEILNVIHSAQQLGSIRE